MVEIFFILLFCFLELQISALTQIYSDFSAISAASALSPHYQQEVFQSSRSIQNQQEGYIGVLKEKFKVLSNSFTC